MTTPIGTAALQIIPSLDGVSKSIERQLGGLKGAGKAVGKSIGSDIASGVDAAAKQVEAASKKIGAARDKEADAAGKLRIAEEKLKEVREKGGAGSQLARAEEARDAALRRQSAALKGVEDQTRDLERAQRRLADAQEEAARGPSASSGAGSWLDKMKAKASEAGESLKGIGEGLGEAGGEAGSGFVEGFSGPIAALGTRAGPIGAALAAAAVVAVGAGSLIAQAALDGMEQEAAADRIQAQLGLSNKDSAEFGKQAGAVYANNFGESFGDVQQSMADVASTIGAGSPALADITAKALTLRDVFGTDVAESVAFAQNLIVNGLAPDAEAAFDLITAAAQRTPAALRDEIPELLSEYNQYFSGLGFSGEQAFGLLVSGADKGAIYMDKIGDTLKEVSLLATEVGNNQVWGTLDNLGLDGQTVANNLLAGGPQAQAQFQELIDKLAEIPDKATQADAAITLFGTPMEDLGKDKIPQFLAALQLGTHAMDGFDGAAQRVVDTAGDNPLASWTSAMRDIETAGAGVKAALGEAFGPTVTDLATTIGENKDLIIEGFTAAGQAGLMFGSMVADSAGVVIGALGSVVGGVGNIVGALKDASAWQEDLFGNDERADQLRKEAQEAYGWGESMYDASAKAFKLGGSLADAYDKLGATGDKMADTAKLASALGDSVLSIPGGKEIKISENTPQVQARLEAIGITTRQLPDGSFEVTPETEQGRLLLDQFRRDAQIPLSTELTLDDTQARDRLAALARDYPQFVGAGGLIARPTGAPGLPPPPTAPRGGDPGAPNLNFIPAAGRAGGGRVDPSGLIRGPGSGVSDSILAAVTGGDGGVIRVSNLESINTAASTRANWPVIEAMNGGANVAAWFESLPAFSTGGAIGPDVSVADRLAGTPYSKAARFDCSGTVARVINGALGTDGGLMTTKTARAWLAARGFVEGSGGPGQIRVGWYDHGPGENDGHMAMTLSDGRNAESGGGNGVFTVGAGADGADSPQFDQHMYLPNVYGEGPPTADGGFDFPAAATAPSTGASAPTPSAAPSSGSGFSLPSSISGLATMGLSGLNAKTKVTPNAPERTFEYGNALSDAVTGQLDSLAGVFGVNGAPPALQALSTFISGIGVSDKSGNALFGGGAAWAPLDAAPLSATSSTTGALPPMDDGIVHGGRAGQQPGPSVNYTINARDTEDAFVRAQRLEKEKAATKLSRY